MIEKELTRSELPEELTKELREAYPDGKFFLVLTVQRTESSTPIADAAKAKRDEIEAGKPFDPSKIRRQEPLD